MSGTAVFTSHQPSFTEWFAGIGKTAESQALRDEDNARVKRLAVLHEIIGLPYEQPVRFPARALSEKRADFAALLERDGDELCAIRLVPSDSTLPKLRNRGSRLRECYETWFLKQAIDLDAYSAEVYPHTDTLLWSAIFVINHEAIFGEIVRGMHAQLTHGDTHDRPARFLFDFKQWQWSAEDPDARLQVERMLAALHVPDLTQQTDLSKKLDAEFSHGYLTGYFETTVWPGDKLYCIDYNRLLGKRIIAPLSVVVAVGLGATLRGMPASGGTARGTVVIVTEQNLAAVNFPDGSVLVCDNTDVRYLPLMKRAAAIITNRGGSLSHAAIVARELGVPCIVGTGDATNVLHNGDDVIVDATAGTVQKA